MLLLNVHTMVLRPLSMDIIFQFIIDDKIIPLVFTVRFKSY